MTRILKILAKTKRSHLYKIIYTRMYRRESNEQCIVSLLCSARFFSLGMFWKAHTDLPSTTLPHLLYTTPLHYFWTRACSSIYLDKLAYFFTLNWFRLCSYKKKITYKNIASTEHHNSVSVVRGAVMMVCGGCGKFRMLLCNKQLLFFFV